MEVVTNIRLTASLHVWWLSMSRAVPTGTHMAAHPAPFTFYEFDKHSCQSPSWRIFLTPRFPVP